MGCCPNAPNKNHHIMQNQNKPLFHKPWESELDDQKFIKNPPKFNRKNRMTQTKPKSRFQRRKSQDNKPVLQQQRQHKLIGRRRSQQRMNASINHKRGNIIELPELDHTIATIQTPSQSLKSQFLDNIQNNVDSFFVKMNFDDVQKVFKQSQKQIQNTKKQNLHNQYKSSVKMSQQGSQKRRSKIKRLTKSPKRSLFL